MYLNTDDKKIAQAANPAEKFEVYGDVLIEKTVKICGKAGRIYLPYDWVGGKVKIIKLIDIPSLQKEKA
jgi:putative transposon-encoded protein